MEDIRSTASCSHVSVELNQNQFQGVDNVVKVLISEGNDRVLLQMLLGLFLLQVLY